MRPHRAGLILGVTALLVSCSDTDQDSLTEQTYQQLHAAHDQAVAGMVAATRQLDQHTDRIERMVQLFEKRSDQALTTQEQQQLAALMTEDQQKNDQLANAIDKVMQQTVSAVAFANHYARRCSGEPMDLSLIEQIGFALKSPDAITTDYQQALARYDQAAQAEDTQQACAGYTRIREPMQQWLSGLIALVGSDQSSDNQSSDNQSSDQQRQDAPHD